MIAGLGFNADASTYTSVRLQADFFLPKSHPMKRTVKLNNPQGLHCRPCSALVALSQKFNANVFIIKNEQKVKTTNILDILCLGIPKGDVVLEAEGDDAKLALDAIEKFLAEYES